MRGSGRPEETTSPNSASAATYHGSRAARPLDASQVARYGAVRPKTATVSEYETPMPERARGTVGVECGGECGGDRCLAGEQRHSRALHEQLARAGLLSTPVGAGTELPHRAASSPAEIRRGRPLAHP
jgi:hypothetical protein